MNSYNIHASPWVFWSFRFGFPTVVRQKERYVIFGCQLQASYRPSSNNWLKVRIYVDYIFSFSKNIWIYVSANCDITLTKQIEVFRGHRTYKIRWIFRSHLNFIAISADGCLQLYPHDSEIGGPRAMGGWSLCDPTCRVNVYAEFQHVFHSSPTPISLTSATPQPSKISAKCFSRLVLQMWGFVPSLHHLFPSIATTIKDQQFCACFRAWLLIGEGKWAFFTHFPSKGMSNLV